MSQLPAKMLGLVVFGFVALAGCNPITDLGEEVIPDLPILGTGALAVTTFADTALVLRSDRAGGFDVVNSFTDRTIVTPNNLVGTLNDPFFGNLRTATYIQFGATSADSNGVRDSETGSLVDTTAGFDVELIDARLSFRFVGSYGNITEPQQLRVFFCTDSLISDSSYTVQDSLAVDRSVDLANGFTFSFDPNNTTRSFSIPFPLDRAQRLLDARLDSLAIDSVLFSLLPPLYLEAEPTNPTALGAVHYLDIREQFGVGFTTRISIDFISRDSSNGPLAQRQRRFIASGNGRSFHSVRRHLPPSSVLALSLDANAPENQQYIPIQGGDLLRLRLKLPVNLDTLPPGVINDAFLRLYVDPAFDVPELLPPVTLDLYLPSTDDSTQEEQPALPISVATYNLLEKTYEVPLRGVIQRFVTGDLSFENLFLVPRDRHFRVPRVMLGGAQHPDPLLRPQLFIFYTPAP